MCIRDGAVGTQHGDVPMSDGTLEQVDVYVPEGWIEQIEQEELDYGDSLSGWIREATRQRLGNEDPQEQTS